MCFGLLVTRLLVDMLLFAVKTYVEFNVLIEIALIYPRHGTSLKFTDRLLYATIEQYIVVCIA